jgi:hypothetical protein
MLKVILRNGDKFAPGITSLKSDCPISESISSFYMEICVLEGNWYFSALQMLIISPSLPSLSLRPSPSPLPFPLTFPPLLFSLPNHFYSGIGMLPANKIVKLKEDKLTGKQTAYMPSGGFFFFLRDKYFLKNGKLKY